MYRLLVADLDSPSYFVATAAVELGCYKQEGVDVELVHDYGAEKEPALLVRHSPTGRAPNSCARSHSIPIGSWRFAPNSTSNVAMSMR